MNNSRNTPRWGRSVLRGAALASSTATLWLVLAAGEASAAIQNPLDGVAPNFGLFNSALDTTWKRVVAFLWAIILIGCAVRVLVGGFKVKRAKKSGYGGDFAEGSEEFQDALVSLGAVAAATPLIGTVLFVVGG